MAEVLIQRGGFQLDEDGKKLFGEVAATFEGLVDTYKRETYEDMLQDPKKNIALSEVTHDGFERVAECMARKLVRSIVSFAQDDLSKERPVRIQADPTSGLMSLNDTLIRNFPEYANPQIQTIEGVLFNRLTRVVRSMVIAILMKLDYTYKAKQSRMAAARIGVPQSVSKSDSVITEADQLSIHLLDNVIGWDLEHAALTVGTSRKPEFAYPYYVKMYMIALHLHGMKTFLRDHKMLVPQMVDIEKLRASNDRIARVIEQYKGYDVPMMVNVGQDTKLLEGCVSELSPLREDAAAYGEYLAQVVFCDRDKTRDLIQFAAANGEPIELGGQTLKMGMERTPDGAVKPTMTQFLLRRDGQVDGYEADYRALQILLGHHRYEILRTSILIEVAQTVCDRRTLQKHLGDLVTFDPERKARGPRERRDKGGMKKAQKSIKTFPRIYEAMIGNAEETESSAERGPSIPHRRLLPHHQYPSERAIQAAKAKDMPIKQIPDEVLDRPDVEAHVPEGVWHGYAVVWYETPQEPELRDRGVKRRIDMGSEDIEDEARRMGRSINSVIDGYLQQHRAERASLRFYTFVSPSPDRSRMIVGKTEADAGQVVASVDDPDAKR